MLEDTKKRIILKDGYRSKPRTEGGEWGVQPGMKEQLQAPNWRRVILTLERHLLTQVLENAYIFVSWEYSCPH